MRKWKSWKEHRSSILAVAVFTLLAVMLFISQNYGGEPEGTVSRQGEGEPTESRTFTYETADGESQQIDLEVHPVERENAEVQQLLERAVEEWEAVFLGENAPEPLGDYLAGPNHVLPTSGTARFFSPLSVDSFLKTMSVLEYSRENLQQQWKQIAAFANAESLTAHANSIEVRFEDETD